MNQAITSSHQHGAPGISHSDGATIIWNEASGGARPLTVLQMLLDRVEFLQTELPCEENEHTLAALREALHWQNVRNEARLASGVQGTLTPHQGETEVDPAVTEEQPPPVEEPTPNPSHPPMPDELVVEEHPNPLHIAIPQQEGRYLSQAVLQSIEAQGIPYRIWISTTFSNGEFAHARNNVKTFALSGESPYILMTDNDLVFQPGDFEAMIQFLEDHPDFGAIALSKHGDPDPLNPEGFVEPTHVDSGPVMFRRSVYEDFAYDNKDNQCECATACDTLRNDKNVRIGFLTGRSVYHILDTRADNF